MELPERKPHSMSMMDSAYESTVARNKPRSNTIRIIMAVKRTNRTPRGSIKARRSVRSIIARRISSRTY